MLERALLLRRKLSRALKISHWFARSSVRSKSPRLRSLELHKRNTLIEPELPPAIVPTDAVPSVHRAASYRPVRGPDGAYSAVRTLPHIDVIPLREQKGLVIPKKFAECGEPDLAQHPDIPQERPLRPVHPLRVQVVKPSPESVCAGASQVDPDASQIPSPSPTMQSKGVTRARSMPLSVGDPLRKLRDSYVRIMHQMVDSSPHQLISPSGVSILEIQSGTVPGGRRTLADEEEEEFCRLALMKVKLRRSVSAL